VRVDHDRLFKELIRTYFKEFIQLFFPEVFEAIDFEHVNFLSEEVFTDLVLGEKRKVDVLIETKLKGEAAMIIVHFESQAQFQKDFSDRMFVYFSRLYEKYRRQILPIAIFSYNEVKNEESSFELSFPFLNVLKFQYYKVELRKKNWRDYINQNNPVAAALLSKMRYTKKERVEVKKEFLRMLVRLKFDQARMSLITGFFDTYLVLNDKEERLLREEIQMLDPEEEGKIMELKSNWEKTAELRGELKGKIQGKLEGKLEGERTILCKFIKAQFGSASNEMVEQITCITNLDLVDRLTDQLFSVSRIEEARKLVEEAFKNQKMEN
jgi:hypothetical protein